MSEVKDQIAQRVAALRGEEMKTPDDVSSMARLKALGWGVKRIAAELGCSKNTVKRWLRYGEWRPCVTPRARGSWTGCRTFWRSAFAAMAATAM